jgi:predicted HicB family RNase H-like nuclease
MGHGLFVVRAVSVQPVSMLVKGLSKGGNISVAEYREHSAEERNNLSAVRAFKSHAQSG